MRRENTRRFDKRALSGTDLWGVRPDGTVWIAKVDHNRLVTIDPHGVTTSGPELPDPVFEVTQADRDRYLQGFPADVRPNETDIPFALVLPPFVGAFGGPGSTVWLEKSKPVLDSVRKIQVLDRAGVLQRVLLLHGQARLLGVGEESLLIAEQFAKGIRLMQVRIPGGVTRP
jgi:hypothetical protein